MKELAAGKQLELHLQLAEDLPALVRGDNNRLRQILLNLIGNAVKFTASGSISLQVKKSVRNQLLFTVSDTGIGIPEDRLHTIFQPFTQAENSISRRYGGSGLGLNICCQLVEKMGGEIWVESIPDQGSTFTFTLHLPAVTLLNEFTPPIQAANDSPPLAPFAATLTPPLRILLVDDVEDNRMLIQIYLETLSHHIVEACNGQQALQLFATQPFDLVLMDVMMPVLDGLETTRRMRQLESLRQWPRAIIVALTANAMKEETEASLLAGCDHHYCKPLRRQQLIDLIENIQHKYLSDSDSTTPPSQPNQELSALSETVNLIALQQMREDLGTGFKRVLNNFLVSIPERLDALNAACRHNNRILTKQLAHKLKGTAATFCADRLSQLCAQLEFTAILPTPSPTQINELLDEIMREGERFSQQILTLVN
ncbi:ATP-binding protein [Candidatus Magnetaquicoccus inordinatus]|uniref:ATP-binding protein n=1 Tax=Candidatus Magnetaquicoccus inordinatus TaxID=2496818 RepID=UPI00102B80BA|nr:ATP-binding protein [Candidatus Magnetaquicoccus inordinatus]